ncbi:MAG: hypothetical protein HOO95_04115 [Gallionella sp.]|nr:hypothetical protein [Gallionella sp.]
MMFRNLSLILLSVLTLVLAGCANVSREATAPNTSKQNIAVMPLDNQTISVAGALYMREEMVESLKNKGYAPMSISDTDLQLANQFGMTLGGQIAIEDLPKIANALGVDTIMTGRLRNFEAVLMSYNQVSASFTMYSANGQVLWSYEDAVNQPFSPLRNEDIRTQIIGGLLGGVIDRSVGRPLRGAVIEFYRRLLYSLPSGWDRNH